MIKFLISSHTAPSKIVALLFNPCRGLLFLFDFLLFHLKFFLLGFMKAKYIHDRRKIQQEIVYAHKIVIGHECPIKCIYVPVFSLRLMWIACQKIVHTINETQRNRNSWGMKNGKCSSSTSTHEIWSFSVLLTTSVPIFIERLNERKKMNVWWWWWLLKLDDHIYIELMWNAWRLLPPSPLFIDRR